MEHLDGYNNHGKVVLMNDYDRDSGNFMASEISH